MLRRLIGALGTLRPTYRRSISRVCKTVAIAIAASGCSAQVLPLRGALNTIPAAGGADPLRSRSPARRIALDGGEEFVVRIVAPGTTCSGTLIAEDLVLTAHHCVSVHDQRGTILPQDTEPSGFTVEYGAGHSAAREVHVRALVTPRCGYAAGVGDLAILVLAVPLKGARVLDPALDWEPEIGEEVSHLGFGRCSSVDRAIQLKHRDTGAIDVVTDAAFRVSVPICPGDSGGPVILRETGELIGVVSAGAMDGDESSADRAEYARLDYFRELFTSAERIAMGTPANEVPPIECKASSL